MSSLDTPLPLVCHGSGSADRARMERSVDAGLGGLQIKTHLACWRAAQSKRLELRFVTNRYSVEQATGHPVSSIPLQLALSPMMIFAVGIKHALDVTVQGS
jgi:hypothetical protein